MRGGGGGRSDARQDKQTEHTRTISDRIVRSTKEENEAGEGVRSELGWLECEKVTVPAPGGHRHLMGGSCFNFMKNLLAEPQNADAGAGLTSEALI